MSDTSVPPRTAGLRGLLPQRQGADRFPIRWVHNYLPADQKFGDATEVDVSQGISEWGMLGNGPDPTLTVNGGKPVGNCFFAAFEHDRMLAGAKPTADETVTLYLTYDKGQDVGVVLADALLSLYQQGLIEAFGPVHPDTVNAVMATFKRGVLTGASLTDDADARFNEHLPWTTSQGETADPAEGHCVLRVKAHADGSVTVVTWGADEDADAGWVAACETEYWVVLTSDDQAVLTPEGWAALIADLNALPGATPPVQPPPPEPSPVPPAPPGPIPPPEPPIPPMPPAPGLLERLEDDVEDLVEDVARLLGVDHPTDLSRQPGVDPQEVQP